ncbi:hypothetical protein ACFV1L_30265 [Kitasatospora sp. NPDC059646]|uniref:hypothetical protein n=1 Tax=Kitasatospora sp. NPDC059646 TaxID=3346893 RepID=UPI0036A38F6F
MFVEAPPELSMGGRIGLVAVCALAAAVLNDLERELPALAATTDAAVAVGRASCPENDGDGQRQVGRTGQYALPPEETGCR